MEDRYRDAARKLIACHREAEQRNEWTFFVDELYAADCIYTCEYAGTMLVRADGREEIRATHYGRDMRRGWEGWSFPYQEVYTGEDGRVVTHWMNRGPGRRADGTFFETPGVSFITFDAELHIVRQHDLFDLAHQMHLCDELEAHGLLSAELKRNWVVPMKQKLVAMLGRNPG